MPNITGKRIGDCWYVVDRYGHSMSGHIHKEHAKRYARFLDKETPEGAPYRLAALVIPRKPEPDPKFPPGFDQS